MLAVCVTVWVFEGLDVFRFNSQGLGFRDASAGRERGRASESERARERESERERMRDRGREGESERGREEV